MDGYEPFFRLLDAFPRSDGMVELRAAIPLRRERGRRAFFAPNERQAMTHWLASRGTYLHAFYGVAFRNGHGGTKNHLTALPALWIDLDSPPFGPMPAEPIPSVVVSSGHGEHWYWLLSSPLRVDTPGSRRAVESLLRGLASRFRGDQSATDVSRVLRVPGTLNPKQDPPRMVTIKRFNSEIRYHPADLFVYSAPLRPESPRPDARLRSSISRPTGATALMLTECSFLRWADDHPENVSEPLWYAAVTNLAVFPDAETSIHTLSEGHPKYSPAETKAKIAHARRFGRPHTCQTIQRLGAAQCNRCPWLGRVRAPSGIPYRIGRVEVERHRRTLGVLTLMKIPQPRTPSHRRVV